MGFYGQDALQASSIGDLPTVFLVLAGDVITVKTSRNTLPPKLKVVLS
ncbi:MAG: hypothetical protein LBE31_06800 [Deltaproteobacteria bacterium]|nr:hypothetical protein [Deltaproteobacteria bacterium]